LSEIPPKAAAWPLRRLAGGRPQSPPAPPALRYCPAGEKAGEKRAESALRAGARPERGAALAARGGRVAQRRRCVPASLRRAPRLHKRRGGEQGGDMRDQPPAPRPSPGWESARARGGAANPGSAARPPNPAVRRCPLRPPPPQPGMRAEQPPADPRSRCGTGAAQRLRAGGGGGDSARS
ncbi:translation initiation factor IF-2-like, partial [Corvus cornix cornix]|uniref:translation initiation factor IF-2-like n=1 Tax=Corvus cornix cornix TaxID=932674 RepID=UPI001950FE9F